MAVDSAKPNLKSFCIKAFNGLSITPSGACAPCCLFERTIQKDDGTSFRIWEDDITEIFNSNFMKDLRRRMLDGESIDACRQCHQVESHGGQSLRTQSNFTEGMPIESLSASESYMPSSIDLKLNNKCNLKCRMCQPKDSHLIFAEFKKIAESDSTFAYFTNAHLNDPDLGIPLSEVPDWSASPVFFEQFTKMLPHLKKISIVGGEPLIITEVYDLLDQVIKSGNANNIFLVITTNLVHLPADRLQKILPHFDRVLFNISLDAIDEELFYIRYPTKFATVKNNFLTLLELRNNSFKTGLQFSPTIQVYNVLSVDKVYLYAEDLLMRGIPLSITPINLTFLEFPAHLNIRILPQSVREAAISKLEALLPKIPLLLKHNQVKNNLLQLIHILRHEFTLNHDYVPEFLYYTQVLDDERKQSGKASLPELFSLLEGFKARAPVESYHQTRERGWRLAAEGKFAEAICEFEVALETSMNKDLDYREIAWMKKSLGLDREALGLYQKSLDLNPTNHYTLKGLATQYSHMGLIVELKSILPLAIKYNPDDQDLLDLARSLEMKQI